MMQNELAWRAIMSHLRAFFIHNVYHDHANHFGKGVASDSVMSLVAALDSGVDLDAILTEVHKEASGVAFINQHETAVTLEMISGRSQ